MTAHVKPIALHKDADLILGGTLDAIDAIAGDGTNLSDTEVGILTHHAKLHASRLKQLAKNVGMKKQLQMAKGMVWNSIEGRTCALVRALEGKSQSLTYSQIIDLANELSVWKPVAEKVVVRWVEKAGKPGEYRPIVIPGPSLLTTCILARRRRRNSS